MKVYLRFLVIMLLIFTLLPTTVEAVKIEGLANYDDAKLTAFLENTGDKLPLNPKVEAYRERMLSELKKEGMEHKLDLMLAIMQVESKGNMVDIMQSSESAGLPRNTLGTDASIKQAIKYMKNIIEQYKKGGKGLENDDMLLAQTYNYGGGFIPKVNAIGKYDFQTVHDYSVQLAIILNGLPQGTKSSQLATYPHVNKESTAIGITRLYLNGGDFLYGAKAVLYMPNYKYGGDHSSSSSSSDTKGTKGSDKASEHFNAFLDGQQSTTQTGVSTKFDLIPESLQYYLGNFLFKTGEFLMISAYWLGAIMLIFLSLQVAVLTFRIQHGGSNSHNVQKVIDLLTGKIPPENLMKRIFINLGVVLFVFIFIYARVYIHVFKFVYTFLDTFFSLF